jgi:hypothetical protein
MARQADRRSVGKLRDQIRGICRVTDERTMARLATDPVVPSPRPGRQHIVVTFPARIDAGEDRSALAVVFERAGPIMSVDAKICRHQQPTKHNEQQSTDRKEPRESHQVLHIPESTLHRIHTSLAATRPGRTVFRPLQHPTLFEY